MDLNIHLCGVSFASHITSEVTYTLVVAALTSLRVQVGVKSIHCQIVICVVMDMPV
jgi:hypothetical protein